MAIHTILETDRAIPDRELLAEVAAELVRTCRTAGDHAAMRGFDRAAYHLANGVTPILSAGDFLVPSATTTGVVYRVSGAGCNCSAGLNGKGCWHSALCEIVSVAWDRQGDEDDGGVVGAFGDEAELPFVPTPEERERERALALLALEVAEWY